MSCITPSRIPSLLRLALGGAAVLLLVSCGRTDLAYRNADWLIERYAVKTVDPDREQRQRWKPLLENELQRHRENELPLVLAYLDLASSAVEHPDGAGRTECLVDAFLLLAERHARIAVELSAPLLVELGPDQVDHLDKYLVRQRAEYREDYLDPDPEKRLAARQERFIERIERWTGRLKPQQRLQIEKAVPGIPDLAESWLTYREQQNQRLIELLDDGAGQARMHAFLQDWWVEAQGRSQQYRLEWKEARVGFAEMLAELGKSLDSKQRRHLKNRLSGIRDDLAGFVPAGSLQPRLASTVPTCSSALTARAPHSEP